MAKSSFFGGKQEAKTPPAKAPPEPPARNPREVSVSTRAADRAKPLVKISGQAQAEARVDNQRRRRSEQEAAEKARIAPRKK